MCVYVYTAQVSHSPLLLLAVKTARFPLALKALAQTYPNIHAITKQPKSSATIQ